MDNTEALRIARLHDCSSGFWRQVESALENMEKLSAMFTPDGNRNCINCSEYSELFCDCNYTLKQTVLGMVRGE